MRLRTEGLLSRVIGGEVMVLDLDTSRYVKVNGSGTLLYELLQVEHDRSQLIRALLDAYEVDEVQATKDVDTFVGQLQEAGLLEGSYA